jgi:hypothetical protein
LKREYQHVNEKAPPERRSLKERLSRHSAKSPQERLADVPTRWRIAIRDGDLLSPRAKTIGYVISTYMSAEGICWPSSLQVARGSGYKVNPGDESNRSAKRGSKELRDAGYLTSKQRRNVSNVYQACFPIRGQECPGLKTGENGRQGQESPSRQGQESPTNYSGTNALRGDEQEVRRDEHGEFVIEEDGTPSFE